MGVPRIVDIVTRGPLRIARRVTYDIFVKSDRIARNLRKHAIANRIHAHFPSNFSEKQIDGALNLIACNVAIRTHHKQWQPDFRHLFDQGLMSPSLYAILSSPFARWCTPSGAKYIQTGNMVGKPPRRCGRTQACLHCRYRIIGKILKQLRYQAHDLVRSGVPNPILTIMFGSVTHPVQHTTGRKLADMVSCVKRVLEDGTAKSVQLVKWLNEAGCIRACVLNKIDEDEISGTFMAAGFRRPPRPFRASRKGLSVEILNIPWLHGKAMYRVAWLLRYHPSFSYDLTKFLVLSADYKVSTRRFSTGSTRAKTVKT